MEEFDFHSLLIIDTHFLSPVGAVHPKSKCPILELLVPLLKELILLLSVDTQGFISGFALIPPWALKKYRAYGTRN